MPIRRSTARRWVTGCAAAAVVAALSLSCNSSTSPSGPAVAHIAIQPDVATLSPGSQLPLTATLTDGNGKVLSGRPIFWAADSAQYATVSQDGVVTGVKVGHARIAASAEGRDAIAVLTVVQVAVASVVVAPSSAQATVGDTTQFTAQTLDAHGAVLTGRPVTWASSNQAVATITPNGAAVARGSGSTTISASSEGQVGTATLNVGVAPVATVTVAPASDTIISGQTDQLTATLKDSRGNVLTGRTVAWSSSDVAIAKVSAVGLVTAVGPGTVNIIATSEGKTGSATILVLAVPVASVVVAPPLDTILVGQMSQFTATLKDGAGNVLTGRPVTWTSSATDVATVNGTGLVTGVAPGRATITASSGGKNGTATIVVILVPVSSITLAPPLDTIVAGDVPVQLTATLKDAGGNVLTGRVIDWTSADDAIATVSGTGAVTGVAPGQTTITAASGGKNATATIVVIPASVNATPDTVTIGTTSPPVTVTAVLKDAKGGVLPTTTVAWTVGGLSAAAVALGSDCAGTTGTCTIHGGLPAIGTAYLIATSEGVTDSTVIIVTLFSQRVGSVDVSPKDPRINVTESVQLVATVFDPNHLPITDVPIVWSSSADAIASVDPTGMVFGVARGRASVMATADGVAGTASVRVH